MAYAKAYMIFNSRRLSTLLDTQFVWHPAYRHLPHPQYGSFLLGEAGCFNLGLQSYPWLPLAQGVTCGVKNSNIDIDSRAIAAALPAAQEALFYHQLQTLQIKGWVQVLGNACTLPRIPTLANNPVKRRHEQPPLSIDCQTAASQAYQAFWLEWLPSLPALKGLPSTLALYLVDDFFDCEIPPSDTAYFMVIKFVGEQLWLSPLIAQHNYPLWQQLQRQIQGNQPVRQFCRQLFPWQHLSIPYSACLNQVVESREFIQQVIALQVSTTAPKLMRINLQTQQVQQHPLSHLLNAVQVQPVVANKKTANKNPVQPKKPQGSMAAAIGTHYCDNNGLRLLPPADTLKKLVSYIDPIVGCFNELSALGNPSGGIYVYKSSFYKTPFPPPSRTLQADHFVQACLGKGLSEAQAKVSALGEAIERQAPFYQSGDAVEVSTPQRLPGRYYSFHHLAPFSETQYKKFSQAAALDGGGGTPRISYIQQVSRYRGEAIHWAKVYSLTANEWVNIPASLVWRNLPFGSVEYGRWQSNGCAAGNTVQEALLQGLLELIERDAVALWWYNQYVPSEIPSSVYCDKTELAPLLGYAHSKYQFRLLDLSHDLGIPVVAAVGKQTSNGVYCLGFGCHLSRRIAIQRAVSEFCQLDAIELKKSQHFNFAAIDASPYLHGRQGVYNALEGDHAACNTSNINDCVAYVVEQLKRQGLETLYHSYHRPNLPLAVVKVFVPGLCHIWPQLGNPRLYHTPRKLGWFTVTKSETQLNPLALNI